MNLWRKLWFDFKELLEGGPGRIQWHLGPFLPSPGKVTPSPEFLKSPIHGVPDMGFALPVDKKVTASITPLDSKGNPAKVDGVPEWATSNTEVLKLTPAADGMSCLIEPVGVLTVADNPVSVQVTCDADLGPGMAPLIGLGAIDVTAGTAATVGINFGPLE